MSLSAWEQQVLDSIKGRLVGSDPTLGALLDTFTRLVSNEDMPAHEQIRSSSRRANISLLGKRRRHCRVRVGQYARRIYQCLGFSGIMMLLCLLASVVMTAVTLLLIFCGSPLRA